MSLPAILISIFIISTILSLLSLTKKLTAMEIVNDMGLGWNLGNSFDCFDTSKNLENPDEQITLYGNIIPKKELFSKIKKSGFKTIRFPVTWMAFMDSSYNVNSEWMKRVKEVVDWIININMYCILNVHNDGENGNWLSEGLISKEKYVKLWSQIAEEFKNYDENLIFESMNDVSYKKGDNYDYETLGILTQSFVDVVRNSGGNNIYRLLLITGANTDIENTSNSDYKMPIDPYNKLAISIHYYYPEQFTVEPDDDPYYWIDSSGKINIIQPLTKWGTEIQYKNMFTYFESMKKAFIDNGIPVIIGEVGVLTEQAKEIESIIKYLKAVFSMSAAYNGIMSCLWDTSSGNFNYYDRVNNKWFDETIRDNFQKISKGKYVNPKEFYIISNSDSIESTTPEGSITMSYGLKKPIKVIFNAYIAVKPLYNAGFGVVSSDKNGGWIGEGLSANEGKKQYDGSYTFTVNVIDKDYNDYIEIQKWWGNEYIKFNYLTIEFEQNFTIFNYKEYKNQLSKY